MRKTLWIALLAGVALAPGVARAQSQSGIEGRVDRLEREMRAVQRKVFPGGNAAYFPPEVTPPAAASPAPGVPATSAVADLQTRLTALESQLATVTGQVEQNQYKIQQLEDAFNAYKRATDTRLKALEGAGTVAADPGTAPAAAAPAPAAAAATKPAAGTTTTPAKPAPAAAAKPADPARARLIAAVEKPVTADPADDLYVYGFRLWQAKLYPEAAAQLSQVAVKYPAHRRASWAQNLLGRSYLDDNQPQQAARAFLKNYKDYPDGERTPDSLYYLTVALKKLGKPSADICKVFDAIAARYESRLSAQLKADVVRGRAEEKCKAA
ncbi:MAG: hypothetical protein K2Y03_12595 [Sphingomonas sp.]|nr:YbgF trimerization domain-containing protein [Sphingomonas sp.]MBX9797717.1 hypothetical protein [Sphingomonas sp.]